MSKPEPVYDIAHLGRVELLDTDTGRQPGVPHRYPTACRRLRANGTPSPCAVGKTTTSQR